MRVHKILEIQFTFKNKISDSETLAVPISENSFGIIESSLEDIRHMLLKIRKLMITYGILLPKQI